MKCSYTKDIKFNIQNSHSTRTNNEILLFNTLWPPLREVGFETRNAIDCSTTRKFYWLS